MGRPAKWKSPTTAIRVPTYLAEELLSIARTSESGDYVQNTNGDRLSISFDEINRRNWKWSAHQNDDGYWFTIIVKLSGKLAGHYTAKDYPTLIDAIEVAIGLTLQYESERESDQILTYYVKYSE